MLFFGLEMYTIRKNADDGGCICLHALIADKVTIVDENGWKDIIHDPNPASLPSLVSTFASPSARIADWIEWIRINMYCMSFDRLER